MHNTEFNILQVRHLNGAIQFRVAPYEHILLVDDNPDDRALVLREIKSEDPGALVSEAKNFDDLKQKLIAEHFVLVITDYQLNWSSGLEVLNKVKESQPGCSVIMYTATGSEEIAVQAMKNGLQDYILKSPNNLGRLRTSIRQTFDQIQQKKALEAAENRYRNLFHSIPIGLYQTSPDGTFLEVNKAMINMLGYSDIDSLMAVDTKELYVHEDHYVNWQKLTKEFGYVKNLEVEIWRADRSVIWVEINGKSVYKDGRLIYNEGSLQDITDRVNAVNALQETASKTAHLAKRNAELYAQLQKYNTHLEFLIEDRTKALQFEVDIRQNSEIALRYSEERYRSVVDKVREAISKIDVDGKVTFLNDAWVQITGYSKEESMDKNLIDFFKGDHRLKLIEGLDDILKSVYSHKQIQLELITHSGEIRWLDVFIDAEKNEKNEVLGVFLILYDITGRKFADDEIKKAYTKEKELNELRAQFVSMTSHEFRTPLASILTSSELLEHYGKQWTPEKNHTHLKRIQSSVQHIISLMDDVLILGKSDAGKLICAKERTDPVQLLHAILDEVQLNTNQLHQIDLTIREGIAECYLDKKLFRQIVNNLLTNSLKYSSIGSTIKVEMIHRKNILQLEFQDSGIGIPKSDQSQLFQSFFRAKNVGNAPGTGLGLPIVKRSIDAHNGSIEVVSEENFGTYVTIKLDVSNTLEVA
jgi:PAS domain S-box-containing protein